MSEAALRTEIDNIDAVILAIIDYSDLAEGSPEARKNLLRLINTHKPITRPKYTLDDILHHTLDGLRAEFQDYRNLLSTRLAVISGSAAASGPVVASRYAASGPVASAAAEAPVTYEAAKAPGNFAAASGFAVSGFATAATEATVPVAASQHAIAGPVAAAAAEYTHAEVEELQNNWRALIIAVRYHGSMAFKDESYVVPPVVLDVLNKKLKTDYTSSDLKDKTYIERIVSRLEPVHTVYVACHGSMVTSEVPETLFTGTQTKIRQRIRSCRLPFSEYPALDSVVLATGLPGCVLTTYDDLFVIGICGPLQKAENSTHANYTSKLVDGFPPLPVNDAGVLVGGTDGGKEIYELYNKAPICVSVIPGFTNVNDNRTKGKELSAYCRTTGEIPSQVPVSVTDGISYMNIINVSTYTPDYRTIAGGRRVLRDRYSLLVGLTSDTSPDDPALFTQMLGVWDMEEYVDAMKNGSLPTYGKLPGQNNLDVCIINIMKKMKVFKPDHRIRIVVGSCGAYQTTNYETSKYLSENAPRQLFCRTEAAPLQLYTYSFTSIRELILIFFKKMGITIIGGKRKHITTKKLKRKRKGSHKRKTRKRYI